MHIHLTAETTCTFSIQVWRQNSVAFEPLTSNYVFRLTNHQTRDESLIILTDQSSYPQNYQSFEWEVNLPVGEYIFQIYNSEGETVEDPFGDLLMAGWLNIHGEATTITSADDEESIVIAYE